MLLDNGVRYTNAPADWSGMVSQGGTGLASSFYATDLSGNARALADPTGAVTDSWAYSAFGEEIAASGSTDAPFRFGGQWGYYRDNPERLYVRARHLDAASGRWLSRDPIGFAGGLNLYGYVGNDPVNGIDPSGHQSFLQRYTSGNVDNPVGDFLDKVLFGIVSNAGTVTAHHEVGKASTRQVVIADATAVGGIVVLAVVIEKGGAGVAAAKEGVISALGKGVIRNVAIGGGTNAAIGYIFSLLPGQKKYTMKDVGVDLVQGAFLTGAFNQAARLLRRIPILGSEVYHFGGEMD